MPHFLMTWANKTSSGKKEIGWWAKCEGNYIYTQPKKHTLGPMPTLEGHTGICFSGVD